MLSDPQPDGLRPADYLTVAVEGPALNASRQVYAGWEGGFTHLAAFFADLAQHWRGWDGSRDYESIEGDFRIEATHGGCVNLRVILSESTLPDGWRVESHVRVDAGEDLTNAAAQVAEVVRAGSQ